MKSLSDQMSVYAAYHRHPVNKAIHFVGIPAIVWSLMVLLSMPAAPITIGSYPITWAYLVVAVVLVYYLLLDYAFGVAATLFFTVLLVTAMQVAAAGTQVAWTAFLVAFVGGWVLQLWGHGQFEKRRPALVENLFQVFIAPLFLVAEVAFGLGLRKELRAEVDAKMQAHA